ncbi:hypothetical protein AB0B15_38435 [Streptomyces sp. NPDC045456]|uniref:hypothetical protein n=1 Tax=Streptomyces sp. NPDC045456 TaxID=3155254 RepID=UPI0033E146F5
MTQVMQWILLVAGNLFVGVAAVQAFKAHAQHEYGRMVAGLLFAVVASVVVWAPDTVFRLLRTVTGNVFGDEKPSEAEKPSGSGGGFPWEAALFGLGGLAASLVLGYGVPRLFRWYKRRTAARRRQEKQAAAVAARRAAIEADHNAVRDAYGEYLADVLAVLDRPALDDVTNPKTAALLHALDAADDARRGEGLDTYRDAVSRLKTAWRAADEHARKTGTSHLPQREQAAISKARKLLARALDNSAGGEYERQTAYAQARELLDGVLTIPRQAAATLETRHRLSLTKAAEPGS